jgi:hypothetical protein
MQPHELGVLALMLKAWQKQLQSYAEKDPSPKLLNNPDFPKMLKAVKNIYFSCKSNFFKVLNLDIMNDS